MKLFYNSIAIHDIGRVSLIEERSQFIPEDSPQRAQVVLVFRVDSRKSGYVENRETLLAVKAALDTQQGQLKLVQERIPGEDGENDLTMFDQMGTVIEHNFPSDPNEWGTRWQQIRITFRLEKHNLTTNAQQGTIIPEGGGPSFVLGTVHAFKEGLRVRRFDEMRDVRERGEGTISARGEILGNMSQTLSARRASLLAIKEQMIAALSRKNATLQYGDFNRVVRLTELDIDVDQATSKLDWSFSASYTRFPNESGYAGAEYEVSLSTESDSGDTVMNLSGRVMAESQSRADAKMESIRTAVIAANDFTIGRRTKTEKSYKTVSSSSFDGENDVGDGDAFIELRFSEEFKKRDPDHLSWSLSIDSREDATSGLINLTYSGSVVCGFTGGPAGLQEHDRAYWVAATKARELGENKHPIRLSGSLKRDDRQITKTAGRDFVRLDFNYSYQVQGSRVYLEAKSQTASQTFGEDSETISGFIVGGSKAQIEEAYATLKAPYAARLIRNEEIGWDEKRIRNGEYKWSSGMAPQAPWAFTAGAGYETLAHRMDFSFGMFKPKADGKYSIKYGLRISKSLKTLTRTTVIQGSLFGTESIVNDSLNEVAGNKLDLLLQSLVPGGKPTDRERSVDKEFEPVMAGANNGLSLKLDFTETMESDIEGDDQILECEVSERIQFSGTRNVIQPIPIGPSVVQQLGITEGRRTVSGHCIAATETTALRWVKKQRTINFPSADAQAGIPGAPDAGTRFDEPPQIEISHVFLPFVDGEVRGDPENGPKLVRVNFTFDQILPNYQYQD